MTSDMQSQAPPGRRSLTRSSEGRQAAGVAAGLARHFDLSPALVRLAFVILSFMGGFGVLLYIICWLLIPEEGQHRSLAEQAFSDREGDGSSPTLAYVLIGIAAITLFGSFNLFDSGMILAAGLFAAGLLLYRNGGRSDSNSVPTQQRESMTPPSSAAPSMPDKSILDAAYEEIAEIAEPPLGDYQPVYTNYQNEPASPPIQSRRRSYLGRLTLAFSLVAVGVMASLDSVGVFDAGISDYLAAILGVIGLGLIVGAFLGRARWLIIPGLLLVPVLLVASLVRVPISSSFGQFSFLPTTVESLDSNYQFGGADVRMDLTRLPALTEDRTVNIDMGGGQLEIVVPSDLNLIMDADVAAGEIVVFDRIPASSIGVEGGGTAVDIGQRAGVLVERRIERILDEGPVLELVVDVAFGSVELVVVER